MKNWVLYFTNLRDVLERAKVIAQSFSSNKVEPEHLWLSLWITYSKRKHSLFCALKETLEKIGIYLDEITEKVFLSIQGKNQNKVLGFVSSNSNIEFSEATMDIIKGSIELVKKRNKDKVSEIELLTSIFLQDKNMITKLLREEYEVKILGFDFLDKKAKFRIIFDKTEEPSKIVNRKSEEDDEEDEEGPRYYSPRMPKHSKTPVLDTFGRDLTKAAAEGKLDPVIGREKEIEKISQVLCRRKKNNPVLIGEPGVGKTAIVEGLAQRIAQGRVPPILQNKRIVALDLGSLVAGTKYRGQFEERVKALLSELEKNKDIIVFIDEIHIVIGAGSASGSLDASNMFKPALTRGDLQCIGATTLDDYREYFEKDPALVRRFQKVLIEPTTAEETLQILMQIKGIYEDHHKVIYTPEALKACVELSEMYITDRYFPDKAIDVLDEAGARTLLKERQYSKKIDELLKELEKYKQAKQQLVAQQMYEEAARIRDKEKQIQQQIEIEKQKWEEEYRKNPVVVTEETIAEVVSLTTGIPVSKISATEAQKLATLADDLKKVVIGQDEAINKVVKAIQRNRAGLRDPNKPIGSFIFLGPTGVGKTHLAKEIAKSLFAREDALIRIDMSEYMERFTVSRLIGAPPGYVGYEEGGQLTEAVRKKPYSVILLDEIEKAHPDVFNILLQILDEGRITDSLGRTINFKNTIIIMTSNIGTKDLREFGKGIGFSASMSMYSPDEEAKSIIEKALRKVFAPEFLNRIDDIIIFSSLNPEHIRQIVSVELSKTLSRIKKLGINVEVSQEVKEFLAQKGYDEKFGARPLKRAIQKYIEDLLAEEIIKRNNNIPSDQQLIITLNKEKETTEIRVVPLEEKKEEDKSRIRN